MSRKTTSRPFDKRSKVQKKFFEDLPSELKSSELNDLHEFFTKSKPNTCAICGSPSTDELCTSCYLH